MHWMHCTSDTGTGKKRSGPPLCFSQDIHWMDHRGKQMLHTLNYTTLKIKITLCQCIWNTAAQSFKVLVLKDGGVPSYVLEQEVMSDYFPVWQLFTWETKHITTVIDTMTADLTALICSMVWVVLGIEHQGWQTLVKLCSFCPAQCLCVVWFSSTALRI